MGRDEGTGGGQPSMEKQVGGISAEIKKLEKELPEIEKGVKQLEEVVKDYTLKLEDEDCSFDEGIQQINESIEELESNIDALKDILNNPDVDSLTSLYDWLNPLDTPSPLLTNLARSFTISTFELALSKEFSLIVIAFSSKRRKNVKNRIPIYTSSFFKSKEIYIEFKANTKYDKNRTHLRNVALENLCDIVTKYKHTRKPSINGYV